MVAETGRVLGDCHGVRWSRGASRVLLWVLVVSGIVASPQLLSLSAAQADGGGAGSERRTGARGVCADVDPLLTQLAVELVRRRRQGQATLSANAIERWLRERRIPYPAPRAFVASAPQGREAELFGRARDWLGGGLPARCGQHLASETERHGSKAAERSHLAVVSAAAWATGLDLPERVRTGSWIELGGTLHESVVSARVWLAYRRGRPRSYDVVAPRDAGATRAWRTRILVDQDGPFFVQLEGDVPGGPRPLLEAVGFANTESDYESVAEWAPGEGATGSDAEDALAKMVDTARIEEGAPLLAVDEQLSSIARMHARALRIHADSPEGAEVRHDLGDGGPLERVRTAGVNVLEVAENAAHAPTVALAHRSLYRSPAHRAALLGPRWTRVGVGVVREASRGVWVCVLFAR